MDGLLSGKLAYVFYVSVADAVILSVVVLVWFRHAVQSSMRRVGMQSPSASIAVGPLQPTSESPGSSPATLSLALFDATRTGRPRQLATLSHQRPLRRRLVLAYALGAAVYATVMTALQLGEQPGLPFVAWIVRGWVNAWPLVPSLVVLLVADRRSMLRLASWYLVLGLMAVFFVTLGGQLLRGTLNSAPITNLYWMLVSLAFVVYAPLALIVVSGWRRIRAVMPVALAGVIVFGFALLAFGTGMIAVLDNEHVRSAVVSASMLSSVRAVYYGLFLIASLPVGWVAWRLLRGIAGGYEHKRFSDVQLIVDCWWLIVAAEQATLLSTTLGYVGVAGALAAFAAYRVVVAMALRWPVAAQRPRRLLLLRVFGYQRRTESLFDRVAQAWRFDGPVQLIAGVDLASRTATPGAILRLLSGRLDNQYVATLADVPARIAGLDAVPDRDGRFRVNDVYCHDDTWRAALAALLDASDCVLMDLRSFSAQNQGCVFELEQMLLRVPAGSIVLVVDKGTDLPLLGATLQRSWTLAHACAGASDDGKVSLVFAEGGRVDAFTFLMDRLNGIGAPDRIVQADALAAAA